MTLRERIDRQIRFEVTESPLVQDLMLGNVPAGGWNRDENMMAFSHWVSALHNAVLTLADEVDALKLDSGESG